MRGVLDLSPELAPLGEALFRRLRDVERIFDRQLESDLPPVTRLVRHVESYRGKMLRPTLVLLSGLAGHPRAGDGITPEDALTTHHLTVAAVVEMVHMATLVHDDVLDEAETRRRGVTVNRLTNNETAVILGDYLIASAYHLCSTLPTPQAALAVGRASMVTCAGELLQLHHREDFSLDEATYFEIVSRKTADLIATSAELGALLSGATPAACGAVRTAALHMGVAFQVQDDLLDLTQPEAVVGKSVGKDVEKGKLTLPLIHHLAHAQPAQRGVTLRLLESAAGDHAHSREKALLAQLESTNSVAAAQAEARARVDLAKQHLATLSQSPARTLLLTLADAIVTRAH